MKAFNGDLRIKLGNQDITKGCSKQGCESIWILMSGRRCLGDYFLNGIYKKDLFKEECKEIQGRSAKGQ